MVFKKTLKATDLTALHRFYFTYLNEEVLCPFWSLNAYVERSSTTGIKSELENKVFGFSQFLSSNIDNNDEIYTFCKVTAADLLLELGIFLTGSRPNATKGDYTRLTVPRNVLIPIEWCIIGCQIFVIDAPHETMQLYKKARKARVIDDLPTRLARVALNVGLPLRAAGAIMNTDSPPRVARVAYDIGSPPRVARVANDIGSPPREPRVAILIGSPLQESPKKKSKIKGRPFKYNFEGAEHITEGQRKLKHIKEVGKKAMNYACLFDEAVDGNKNRLDAVLYKAKFLQAKTDIKVLTAKLNRSETLSNLEANNGVIKKYKSICRKQKKIQSKLNLSKSNQSIASFVAPIISSREIAHDESALGGIIEKLGELNVHDFNTFQAQKLLQDDKNSKLILITNMTALLNLQSYIQRAIPESIGSKRSLHHITATQRINDNHDNDTMDPKRSDEWLFGIIKLALDLKPNMKQKIFNLLLKENRPNLPRSLFFGSPTGTGSGLVLLKSAFIIEIVRTDKIM